MAIESPVEQSETSQIKEFLSLYPKDERGRILRRLQGAVLIENGSIEVMFSFIENLAKHKNIVLGINEFELKEPMPIKRKSRTAEDVFLKIKNESREKMESLSKTVNGRKLGPTAYSYAQFLMEKSN